MKKLSLHLQYYKYFLKTLENLCPLKLFKCMHVDLFTLQYEMKIYILCLQLSKDKELPTCDL